MTLGKPISVIRSEGNISPITHCLNMIHSRVLGLSVDDEYLIAYRGIAGVLLKNFEVFRYNHIIFLKII